MISKYGEILGLKLDYEDTIFNTTIKIKEMIEIMIVISLISCKYYLYK